MVNEIGRDYLIVDGLKEGQRINSNVEIQTYDDHRVAMCFSLVACGGVPGNEYAYYHSNWYHYLFSFYSHHIRSRML